MQSDAVADQLGGQEVALDHLSDGEHPGHQGDVDPSGKLGQSDAETDRQADQHTEIGDERDEPGCEADDEAEVETDEAQSDAVEDAEDEAHRGLAADEPGQGAVDLQELLAHHRGRFARQQGIEPRDDAVPVAQQVEGHQGRDQRQRQEVEQRHAAAPELLEETAQPGDHLAGVATGDFLQPFAAVRRDTLGEPLQQRSGAFAQGLAVLRDTAHEARHLCLQQRDDE